MLPTGSARLAATLLAAVLGLAACGQGQPGSAAVVEDRRIGVLELQESTRELLDARAARQPDASEEPADEATAQLGVLTQLVRSELLEEAAERNGVQVSEGQVDELLRQFEQQAGGREALEQDLVASGVPPSRLREIVRFIANQNALGERLAAQAGGAQQQGQTALRDLLVETARQAGVEVNPRYGTWDAEQLEVVGSPSGGLATPVTSAAPVPAPAPAPAR
ncbi:MAG: SurA N-terminal domain-containing protein [Actinomycetota bacterium]|nr:SurA N-terminal domain-containing protein [Actinomycetota bacterium]